MPEYLSALSYIVVMASGVSWILRLPQELRNDCAVFPEVRILVSSSGCPGGKVSFFCARLSSCES